MSPKVTILTAAFEAARFVERAARAVRDQTMSDWEWVVVDDASKDDTFARLEALAAVDPRIRPLRAPRNGGPAAARALGLAAARGEWVAVFDIDDAMEPWRLARLVATAESAGADIVADDMRIAPETELFGPGEPFLGLRADEGASAVDLATFLDTNILFGPERQTGYLKPMFRRAMLARYGLTYDARLRIGEDFAIVAAALAHGARYVIDPAIGYRYGVRADSISRVMRPEDVEALLTSDDDLVAAHPALLQGEAGAALRRRRTAFERGLAYMKAIEALKRRDLLGAMRVLARRPAAATLLRLPLLVRLERLVSGRRPAPPPPLAKPDAAIDPRRVLVVIPTLDEERHIEGVLAQLIEGDPRMRDVRVVVADGGSRDSTRARVAEFARRAPNVVLLDNPERLQSAAVNRAVAAHGADMDVLVRCDAHAAYPASYVLDVAQALVQRDVDSLVVPMDARGEGCFQRAVAWIVDTPLGAGGAAHRGGRRSGYVDHGHHAAFKVARFRELGGYDPTFSHNEDAEYDKRLAASGGRIFLEAGLRKIYYPRTTFRALWRQYRNYGRGRARTILKHAAPPAPRQMAPVANLVLQVSALALAPLAPVTLVAPAAYLGALVAVSALTASARGSLCGLGAGPALFAIHTAWAIGFVETVAPALVKPRRARPSPQAA
ncbi:MAG: glycosyltransferase [Alphaproteobacteria bacterium]|nr:glycosyltransferase [Alphaproteobacteria bacterium]